VTALSTVPLPATIAAVDGRWLTTALRDSGVIGPGARVATVEARRIALETGFSSELYRLRLTGDDGVPASVVVKMPTGTSVREAMDLVGGYRREVTFYERVAGRAPLGTPRVYAARMAEASSDFVLVLEDLGDWDNADHLAGLRGTRPAVHRGAGRPARLVGASGQRRPGPGLPEPGRPGGAAGVPGPVRRGLAGVARAGAHPGPGGSPRLRCSRTCPAA